LHLSSPWSNTRALDESHIFYDNIIYTTINNTEEGGVCVLHNVSVTLGVGDANVSVTGGRG